MRFKSCISCVNWPKSEMCGPCKGIWTGFSNWVDAVEAAVAAERSRCMHAAEAICVAMANAERVEMGKARAEGRQEAEGFFGHGAFVADELNQAIYKAINAGSQEDPIAEAVERCAGICKEIGEEYSRLAGTLIGNLTEHCVGYAVARECERRIRGEK